MNYISPAIPPKLLLPFSKLYVRQKGSVNKS
jgi:hypothetical protein